MKKIILIALLFIIPIFSMHSDLFEIDGIVAVIFGSEGTEIVTQSDINRPSLGGGLRTLDEIIFERLVFLDAQKHKIFPDEEAVDAYLRQIQRENNLTSDELKEIFTGAGYTFEEGRQQLQMMQTVNIMLDHKIRSNLIVPRKDVEAYYKEHLVIIEASYTLERAFISFSKTLSQEELRTKLEKFAQTGKGIRGIEWSDPFTVYHSDIAEDKQYIYDMQPGMISMPHEVVGGFELFRLKDKTEEYVQSLDESYREIADILRRPKYEELMQEYRQSLFDNASIIYF